MNITGILPFLIPIIIAEVILLVVTIRHILNKKQSERDEFEQKQNRKSLRKMLPVS